MRPRRRAPPKKRTFTDYFDSSSSSSEDEGDDTAFEPCIKDPNRPQKPVVVAEKTTKVAANDDDVILCVESPDPTSRVVVVAAAAAANITVARDYPPPSAVSSCAVATLKSSSSPSWPHLSSPSQSTVNSTSHGFLLATQQPTPPEQKQEQEPPLSTGPVESSKNVSGNSPLKTLDVCSDRQKNPCDYLAAPSMHSSVSVVAEDVTPPSDSKILDQSTELKISKTSPKSFEECVPTPPKVPKHKKQAKGTSPSIAKDREQQITSHMVVGPQSDARVQQPSTVQKQRDKRKPSKKRAISLVNGDTPQDSLQFVEPSTRPKDALPDHIEPNEHEHAPTVDASIVSIVLDGKKMALPESSSCDSNPLGARSAKKSKRTLNEATLASSEKENKYKQVLPQNTDREVPRMEVPKDTEPARNQDSSVANANIKKQPKKRNRTKNVASSNNEDVAVHSKESVPLPAIKTEGETNAPKRKKMNFQDTVLNHMLLAFKPFTLRTLATELNTTETQLEYVMLSLSDKGLVCKKDFTSAKNSKPKILYWALYGVKAKEVVLCVASTESMESSRKELDFLLSKKAALQKALQDVNSVMSNQELENKLSAEQDSVDQLRKQLEDVKERIQLSKHRKGAAPSSRSFFRGPQKSAAELARERCPRRMKIRINNMRKEWIDRKEKCLDFIDQMADGMEKKPKDILKLLEIETDEMAGVKLPPKKSLDP